MPRRLQDRYLTPNWQTRALLAHQPGIDGLILEPCCGDGGMARAFARPVVCNDLDPQLDAPFQFSAADPLLYDRVEQTFECQVDWVITNPPYAMPLCRDIVALAIERAAVGVAMLLRLSFLEPTHKIWPRGKLLTAHPPTRLLVLPRHSYTDNRQTDLVTTAWVIWCRPELVADVPPIECLYLADRAFGTEWPAERVS
jgi:hypothetical protein